MQSKAIVRGPRRSDTLNGEQGEDADIVRGGAVWWWGKSAVPEMNRLDISNDVTSGHLEQNINHYHLSPQ